MKGIYVFIIAFIVTIISWDAVFTNLVEPARSYASVGIGIMLAISFIKK